MKNKIIVSKDPYVLDEIENLKLPALTKKNSDFIEAIIHIDSNYKKDCEVVGPDDNFKVNEDSKNSNGKYCGSIKFWFSEMEKGNESKYSYAECLWGAVIAIDRSNSTHLETTNNGRSIMASKIKFLCPNLNSLKIELEKSFVDVFDNHLIANLLRPEGEFVLNRFYLSFVSKFCAYAVQFLNLSNQYSKYDRIVAESLPKYYEQYCGKEIKPSAYLINNSNVNYKNENAKDKFFRVLKIYKEYTMAIGELLDYIKNENLDRNKVDHIIWYGTKGK